MEKQAQLLKTCIYYEQWLLMSCNLTSYHLLVLSLLLLLSTSRCSKVLWFHLVLVDISIYWSSDASDVVKYDRRKPELSNAPLDMDWDSYDKDKYI